MELTNRYFRSFQLDYYIVGGRINIALKKPAYQINTYTKEGEDWSASNAVDGIIHGDKSRQGIHTEGSNSMNWWIVDLEDDLIIDEIHVYARKGQGTFVVHGNSNIELHKKDMRIDHLLSLCGVC